MYDFYYDTKEKIKKNPEDFLIFVKKLLPRWINGIPDGECLAIYKILKTLKKRKKKKLVLTETGCGASTIAMFLHCALYGGKLYSWDTNASKGSFLKGVISESVGLNVDVNKIWTFIPSNSLDPHVGLRVLNEIKSNSDFCFFDTWHTLEHVFKELKEFEKIASSKFIVAFDDAYYTKKHTNYTFINVIRSKLNLKRLNEPKHNISKPFYIEIDNYLKKKYKKVKKIKDHYKLNIKNDSWFKYYSDVKDFGISSYEKKFNLKDLRSKSKIINHRFDAFFIE